MVSGDPEAFAIEFWKMKMDAGDCLGLSAMLVCIDAATTEKMLNPIMIFCHHATRTLNFAHVEGQINDELRTNDDLPLFRFFISDCVRAGSHCKRDAAGIGR